MKFTVFFLLSALFIALVTFSVGAQDTGGYVIQSIDVDSKGLTGKLPVLIKTEMKSGTVFRTREEIDGYLEMKRQILENTRLFNEIVLSWEPLEGEIPTGEPVPIVIRVRLVETWNLIVLPYGRYDNNTGLTLSLRLRDYNFLGTMETLSVNLNYILYDNNEDKSEYSAEIGYKYNFQIGPQPFSLSFDQAVQFFTFKEENPNEEPYYLSTGLKLGTFFPTPILVFNSDRLNYFIDINFSTNYSLNGFEFEKDEDLKKFNLGLTHGFEVSRINWNENYRNGYRFSLEQKYYYNFIIDQLDINTSLDLRYHTARYPVQFSGRLKGEIRGFSATDLGDNLRGVLDASVEGMGGVFLNTNLLLTLFRIPKFMEMQAGLICDFGYAFGLSGGSEFQSPLYTGLGIEVLAYPAFSRSLFLRASLAFNVEEVWEERSLSGDGNWEVFIGLGHYF